MITSKDGDGAKPQKKNNPEQRAVTTSKGNDGAKPQKEYSPG